MTEYSAIPEVVVLGGGCAGTLAANRLRTRGDVEISLVNSRPRFVDRGRLIEVPSDPPVTVVGGGPTGIATAAELAELGRSVTLVCGYSSVHSARRRTWCPTGSPEPNRRCSQWRGFRQGTRRPGSVGWINGDECSVRPVRRKVASTDEHAERFTLFRPLLFTVAYEILGTATESDDVL